MRKIVALALALLATTPALAQVRQSGTVTPKHFTCWTTNGVVQDCGTAASPVATSIGTVGAGPSICASSGPVTGPYNQLCLAANANSAAQITLQSYGGAADQNLQLCTNGGCFTVPSTVAGDLITGTPPFTNTGIPAFSGTTGVVIDSGVKAASGTITDGAWGGTNIPITKGGTGAASAPSARTNLGLGTMATQDASAVAITGGTITGLPTPTASSDAATKNYVDSAAAGLIILPTSALATAAVLPNTPTYSNGASGVGATLTAGSNTTLTVDGTAAPLATVVLVKNQASTFQNGIYTVTTAGDGSNAWVLTRATYFDVAAEMLAGSYTYITSGATNANNAYVLQTTVATVGSSAVTFNLFNSAANTVTSVGALTGVIGLGDGLTTSSTNLVVDRTTVRTKITGALALYVRSDGSNSNTCLANSAGAACLTVQGAMAKLQGTYDLAGFQATINIVNDASTPQTYTATGAPIASLIGPLVGAAQRTAVTVPTSAACPVIIKSLTGTATDIVLTANTNTMFADAGGFFCVQDVTVASTSGSAIRAGGAPSGGIDLSNVILGAATSGKIFTSHGANVEFYGNISVSGNSTCVLEVDFGGFIFASGITITQLADFTISKAFACVSGGQLSYISNTFTTGGFTVTGPKFAIENGGKIITTGNDLTTLPGTTGGTMSSGTYDDYTGPLPCTLGATVSANALTVALLDSNGNTPTSVSPCSVTFRNPTVGSGLQNKVVITSATTFVTATSGSTFGASNSNPFRLWFTLLNNSGAVQLGVSRQSDSLNVYPLLPGLLQTSTTCNACGTASSAGVIYSTSGLSLKPMVILGYADWALGLATAGVWSANPTVITNWNPGMPLPGQPVQVASSIDGTQVQASGVTKVATSLTKTIQPKFASSMLRITATGPVNITTSLGQLFASLSRDNCTSTTGSTALAYAGGTTGASTVASLQSFEQAPSIFSPTTYVVCVWGSAAAANAYTWNYTGAGATVSVIIIEEIMG